MEVRLNPNSVYYDRGDVQIRTLLGSCIAITFWHSKLKCGFMCHFSQPRAPLSTRSANRLDARFADDSLEMFKRMALLTQTKPQDYEVKVFGGGNMFYDKVLGIRQGRETGIGEQNAERAFGLLLAQGFRVAVADVGEFGYRDVIFNLNDGSVLVKLSGRSPAARKVRKSLGEEIRT